MFIQSKICIENVSRTWATPKHDVDEDDGDDDDVAILLFIR